MFHFTRKRIEAHVCICFIALKVYKEMERILKLTNIGLSVDKVLAMARTITTIQIKLPLNQTLISKTFVLKIHKITEPLFDEDLGVRIDEVERSIFWDCSPCFTFLSMPSIPTALSWLNARSDELEFFFMNSANLFRV
jgi:hypothetical protein